GKEPHLTGTAAHFRGVRLQRVRHGLQRPAQLNQGAVLVLPVVEQLEVGLEVFKGKRLGHSPDLAKARPCVNPSRARPAKNASSRENQQQGSGGNARRLLEASFLKGFVLFLQEGLKPSCTSPFDSNGRACDEARGLMKS